jgi:hypothetical protein
MAVPQVLLWLFVLNLGIVFGAGLYEARISVPRWVGVSGQGWHAQEALRDDAGRRFWAFTTTIPLTLLTFANLWAAWQSSATLRMWWLTAALVALVERIFTFSYFIPRMVGLLRSADSPEAGARMRQWVSFNYLRQLLALGQAHGL